MRTKLLEMIHQLSIQKREILEYALLVNEAEEISDDEYEIIKDLVK